MFSSLPRRPGRILELGNGTDLLIEHIHDLAPWAEIIFFELCDEGPGKGTPSRSTDVSALSADGEEAWPRGRFDCVVSSLSLQTLHPEERSFILRQIAGCLLPGGRFICGDVFCTEHRWVEKVLRYQWIAHMMRIGIPEEIMQGMVVEREAKYQDFDTLRKFRQRLLHSGFSRELVPFTAGFLGVVVSCISNRGQTTGYLD
jgi:SAM-dependent methyltransferase